MRGRRRETEQGRRGPRRAAAVVAGFLGGFLVLNTYWSLNGRLGLEWILGPDVTVSLVLVWAQEVAIVFGIALVLDRGGIRPLPIPAWIHRAGIWSMALAFGAVGLYNLIGDNTTQARFLFAPLALVLGALCVAVAHRRPDVGNSVTDSGPS